MTATVLAPYLTQQFLTNIGMPLAGGLLFSYQAGTVTPTATYTDNTGTVQNANPIVLNARGEVPAIWVLPNTSYKFVLQDALANPIWTRDNVIQNQFLSLFGGLDTGAPNSYILNFAAPFTGPGYTNGTVIYWVPSNTNTGPSTLNVNGIGPVPIVNIDGSALGAGQIVAGQMTETVFYNGSFQLLSIGNFVGATIGTFGTEIPIASVATTDLGTVPAHAALITGTATITSFGTSASLLAPFFFCRVASVMTLTFNATSLILPGNANIVTTPGDAFIMQYLGGGNWKCTIYQTASSAASNAKIKPADTSLTTASLTLDPDLQSNTLIVGRYQWDALLIFDSAVAANGFKWQDLGSALDTRGIIPATASGQVNAAAYGPKNESPYGAPVVFTTLATTANSNIVHYTGSILVGTPGTFGVYWAQNTANASPTILRAGSYLIFTLLTTGSAANSVEHLYTTPGTFVETIPAGQTKLTIEVWGGSGAGGSGIGIFPTTNKGGGGGGSGAYCRTQNINVTGQAGNTMNFTVAAAGLPTAAPANGGSGATSSVSSGTFSMTTLTAGGGVGGAQATGAPGSGGAGGTATGGAVNTNGNNGQAGDSGPGVGGPGGPGIAGLFNGGAAGGSGANVLVSGATGGNGLIVFYYTP